MTSLRKALLKTMTKACTDESTTLQPAHVKDILKLALVAIRHTKRIVESMNELSTIWQPSSWSELSNTLASSNHFKGSVGLQATCKQIVQLLQENSTAGSKARAADKAKSKGEQEKAASATKRKAAEREEDGDEEIADGGKKAKHKKARKVKSS